MAQQTAIPTAPARHRVLIATGKEKEGAAADLWLRQDGYETLTVRDLEAVMSALSVFSPDVLLLDDTIAAQGGRDPHVLCQELRERRPHLPIIVLTHTHGASARARCLTAGADDCLEDPFVRVELLARVQALLRRSSSAVRLAAGGAPPTAVGEGSVSYPDLQISLTNYTVIIGGTRVEMPPRELELFYFLASQPGRVFSREQLLNNIWGYEYDGDIRTVDVHIKRIRKRTELPGLHPSWKISTVWGVGYKFEAGQSAR